MFDAGSVSVQCRTINSHCWPSTSAFHDKIDGKKVGSLTSVCDLMKGVFNLRPPQTKYTCIWDVQIVLHYIKENWPEN